MNNANDDDNDGSCTMTDRRPVHVALSNEISDILSFVFCLQRAWLIQGQRCLCQRYTGNGYIRCWSCSMLMRRKLSIRGICDSNLVFCQSFSEISAVIYSLDMLVPADKMQELVRKVCTTSAMITINF